MTPADFLKRVRASFNHPLPGIKAHRLMTPGKRPLTREEVASIAEYRESAVAIICYPFSGNIHAILIQRPPYEGTHGGQISFPGGKSDAGDLSLEHTARREVMEEIGWTLSDVDYLGKLTELFIPVSKFSVQPFLYYCQKPQSFIPDPREVAGIIHFPVAELNTESVIKTTTIKMSSGISLKNVPYFDLNQHIVWGATAIILSELREMLKK